MKNLFVFYILLLVTVEISSCQPGAKKPIRGAVTFADREMTGDEIRETGRISRIEDSGYPMFLVTVEFPERLMQIDFNLNAESIGLDPGELAKLKGKYVVLYYLSETEQNIFDIHFKGKSLLGEYAPETDPSWETITGILKGATTETAGDLPDEIFVTDSNGVKFTFKYFITPEMVAVNGKRVTVWYSSYGVQTITYLRALKD